MMNPHADIAAAPAEATGRWLRFLCVGGAAALVQLALVSALHEVARWPESIAVSIAYAGSVAFHFLANRWFTFGQQGGISWVQLRRYLTVAAVNYGLTLLIFTILAPHAGIYLATAGAILATTGFGYVTSRHWIFPPERGLT